MSPDRRIARLASRQQGQVTRAQLGRAGLSPAEVATRIRRGQLIRRFHGVYAVGHVPEGRFPFAFAAWLAYGRTAGLSHGDGAAVLGLLPPPTGPVHVTRPGGGRSQSGTVLHKADAELWSRAGLLVTSPSRLMLDLAATEPASIVERAYNEAQILRLLTPSQLKTALKQGWDGRRGAGVLRELVDDVGVSRSALEDAFRRLVRDGAFDRPERNVWIDGVFVDAVWRDRGVIVELDGRRVHEAGQAFEADRRKANVLQLKGWIVLRFTYRRLTREPLAVAVELAAALASAPSRAIAR